MSIRWQGIVIHCTETDDRPGLDWAAIRCYHLSKGWLDIGYNFGIESIGGDTAILAGRPMSIAGAHCLGHNTKYLGFAFVCRADEVPAPDTLKAAARFLAGLLDALGLPRQVVWGHKELCNTSCPDLVPMAKLKRLILEER